jgi:putative membrane protein
VYLRHGISAREVLRASAKFVVAAAIWSTCIVVLHKYLDVRVLALPALPVTTIGIGVSLYLGFKTTSAYNRWW